MEWIDGVKLKDVAGMVALNLRPRDVGLQLANAFGQMIFEHGFIHGGEQFYWIIISLSKIDIPVCWTD